MKHISQAIKEHKEFVDKILQEGSGWMTPYTYLNNELMPGIPFNTITAIGGHSGVGKTSFLLSLIFNAPILNPKMECHVFSLEMPARALVARRHSFVSGRPVKEIITEEVDISLFTDIENLPIYFYEHDIQLERIYSIIDEVCKKSPDKDILIAIDHSLLIDAGDRDDDNKRVKRVVDTMLHLKMTHKNFNCIIISQLNDAMMKDERLKKKGELMFPQYTDMMNGRQLYQLCDTVMILNEPAKYVERSTDPKLAGVEYNGFPLTYIGPGGTRGTYIYLHTLKGRDTGTSILAYKNRLYKNHLEEIDISKINKNFSVAV